MRKFIFPFFSLPILLALAIPVVLGKPRTILVSGRTVDGSGKPVARAVLTLYTPPCLGCMDHVLPAAISSPDGSFAIDSSGISLNQLRLFVSGPVPIGFWSPLSDSAGQASSQGIPIRLRRRTRQVDVGDVVVRLLYAKVTIELPESFGSNLIEPPPGFPDIDLWLADGRGKVVHSGLLPKSALDPKFKSINLALPNGKWTLKLRLQQKDQRRAYSHVILVKHLNPVTIAF